MSCGGCVMLVQQLFPYYSLGYWFGKIRDGDVFTCSKGNLLKNLEKYLPLILEDFPLPLAIIAPALNPKNNRICMQIVQGEDFFEAMYQFYQSNLNVCPKNFLWLYKCNMQIPDNLTWDTASDEMREKIFYTGIYVTELLPLEDEYFTCAQIEQLSKIDFSF